MSFGPAVYKQGRADLPPGKDHPKRFGIGRHLRAVRIGDRPHRSPAPCPVLKSITARRRPRRSRRSTVPAITRPSGKVAASGASAERARAEQRREARIGQDAANLARRSPRGRRRRRPRPNARASGRPLAARSPASTAGKRSSNWWIQVPAQAPPRASPRSAAARFRRRPRSPTARAGAAAALRAARAAAPTQEPESAASVGLRLRLRARPTAADAIAQR